MATTIAIRARGRRARKYTYNTRLVRRGLSYSIQEIAELFGLHPNAVRRWAKDGLPTIDDRRPHLVYGADLIEFLNRRQKGRKRPCAADEMFCCRCRAPRRPAGGRATIEQVNARQFRLQGTCEVCGAPINRGGSLARLPEVAKAFTITAAPAHLDDTAGPVVKCDLEQGA